MYVCACMCCVSFATIKVRKTNCCYLISFKKYYLACNDLHDLPYMYLSYICILKMHSNERITCDLLFQKKFFSMIEKINRRFATTLTSHSMKSRNSSLIKSTAFICK